MIGTCNGIRCSLEFFYYFGIITSLCDVVTTYQMEEIAVLCVRLSNHCGISVGIGSFTVW